MDNHISTAYPQAYPQLIHNPQGYPHLWIKLSTESTDLSTELSTGLSTACGKLRRVCIIGPLRGYTPAVSKLRNVTTLLCFLILETVGHTLWEYQYECRQKNFLRLEEMFALTLCHVANNDSVTCMNTYQITPNPSLPATAMANVWAGYTVRLVRRIGFGNVQVALNNGQIITVHNSNLRNI